MYINLEMLKEAAESTKGNTIDMPGYTQIIYNLEFGDVWAVYHHSYNSWTNINHETEIVIDIKTEHTAEELQELIEHEIRHIQKELKEPGATEELPKKWVRLINNIKL